jgi:tRNA(Ile)-lysidine synthase
VVDPAGERPDLPARLDAACARLIGRPVAATDRFGLAVSGGADSMAMLDAAVAVWPGQVEVATVDHGLRVEAAREAAMVAAWCARHGAPYVTLRPAEPIAGNLMAQARKVRYRLLEDWQSARALGWLLTAHQADDRIETLIMRLNRGSGVAGLAGVRARRGRILRPLLAMRRAELRAWCAARCVPFVDDPTNEDPQYDRARLRAALAGFDLFEPAGLNRALEALAEASTALDWAVEQAFAAHVRAEDGQIRLERTDLPAAILRALLMRMLAAVHPAAPLPRGPSIDQALVQLLDGKTVALADCLVAGGAMWIVRRAPPRRQGL